MLDFWQQGRESKGRMEWEDELVTIEDAARLLATSEATLLLLIQTSEIPVVEESGQSTRIRRSDIKYYMVNHYRTRK